MGPATATAPATATLSVEPQDKTFHRTGAGTSKYTKKFAREYKDMVPAPGDRRHNDNRTERLRTQVENGTMRPPVWIKCFCKATGIWYRANGKHTSELFLEMNGAIDGMDIHWESYEANTLLGVAALYGTIDSAINSRTTGDITQAYVAVTPGLEKVELAVCKAAVAGLAYYAWGPQYQAKTTHDERVALLETEVEFVLAIRELMKGISGRERSVMKRTAVVAAIAGTWEKAPAKAMEFWGLVRNGSGSNHLDPDRKLHKFLYDARVSGASRRPGSASGGLATSHEIYVKCLHAWNAWRRGVSTSLKYYPGVDDPKII